VATSPREFHLLNVLSMRRTLSVLLVLLFWLGPLTALLPANHETRLPACCRRHGMHHCAMAAALMAGISLGSTPALTAPAHCPYFPEQVAVATAPVDALTVAAADLPVLLQLECISSTRLDAVRSIQLRAHVGRGPPALKTA